MKLNQVEFHDWRCFLGKQTIRFATDHGKSVTAVWGANSSGKTTILNGILWALWGTLTDDFQWPTMLVNDTALLNAKDGETLSAYVEVKFEHGGNRYTMKRLCSQKKSVIANSESLETHENLRIVNSQGETFWLSGNEAFSAINQILPKVLATYFFFNGEKFAAPTLLEQRTLGDAVKQVIGLTKYERALKHIAKAKNELNLLISNLEKNADLKGWIAQKEQEEHKLSGLQDDTIQIDKELAFSKKRYAEIVIEQSSFQEIKELIAKREGVTSQLDIRKVNLKNLQGSRTELLGDLYTSLVLVGVSPDVTDLAESHRRQKHIPADFKKSFIEDLLSSGVCICGCHLATDSAQYKNVHSRLNEGALVGTEESWTMLASGIAGVDLKCTTLKQIFTELNGKISSEDKAISDLIEKLSSFDDSVLNTPAAGDVKATITALESERKRIVEQLLELTRKSEKNSVEEDKKRQKISDCDRQINLIMPKNEEAKLNTKRRRYLSQVHERLEEELAGLKVSLRHDLEMSITTIFRSLSNNSYFAVLDEDFALEMCSKDDAGNSYPAPMGSGENQLKYYSFMAALSKLNFESSQSSQNIHQSFPMMIDAPFSLLDSEIAKRVAQILPRSTHQPIFLNLKRDLMTMKTPEVAHAIGEVSVLKLFVEKDKEFPKNESIELDQGSFEYVLAIENLKKRYTEIVKVS